MAEEKLTVGVGSTLPRTSIFTREVGVPQPDPSEVRLNRVPMAQPVCPVAAVLVSRTDLRLFGVTVLPSWIITK